MSACALLLVANKDHALVPVLREYESLLEAKRLRRGLRPGDDVIDARGRRCAGHDRSAGQVGTPLAEGVSRRRTIRPGLYSSQITACDSLVVRKSPSSLFQLA
jgi:hypothetical protein